MWTCRSCVSEGLLCHFAVKVNRRLSSTSTPKIVLKWWVCCLLSGKNSGTTFAKVGFLFRSSFWRTFERFMFSPAKQFLILAKEEISFKEENCFKRGYLLSFWWLKSSILETSRFWCGFKPWTAGLKFEISFGRKTYLAKILCDAIRTWFR